MWNEEELVKVRFSIDYRYTGQNKLIPVSDFSTGIIFKSSVVYLKISKVIENSYSFQIKYKS